MTFRLSLFLLRPLPRFTFILALFAFLLHRPERLPDVRSICHSAQSGFFLFFDGQQRVFSDFGGSVPCRIGILYGDEFLVRVSNLRVSKRSTRGNVTYVLIRLTQNIVNTTLSQEIILHHALTDSRAA